MSPKAFLAAIASAFAGSALAASLWEHSGLLEMTSCALFYFAMIAPAALMFLWPKR
jgi:hypothetical protein